MATRKDEKAARREERLQREAAAEAAAQRKRRLSYLLAGLAALAVVAAIVALVGSGGGGGGGSDRNTASRVPGYPAVKIPPPKITSLAQAARAAGCTTQSFQSAGQQHVSGTVKYATNPPTSGPHNQIPANDGVYTSPPAKENFVHSLEHGRIELQFKPGAPAAVRGALKAVFDEDPSKTLLFPNNTGMPYEVAATAWTQLLGCARYNDRVPDALRAFSKAYKGRGPEQVP
jgi:hypothetical protein